MAIKKKILKLSTAAAYALSAFVAAGIYNLVARHEKVRHYGIVANVKKTDELKENAPVRMSGVDVGRIGKMELLPDFSVDIMMEVAAGTRIPSDSIAAIYTDGLMGQKYVNIIAGGSEDYMRDGDSFEYTQDSVNIYEMLETGISQFKKSMEK